MDIDELPAEMFQSEDLQYQNRPGKKRALTKKMRRHKLYHFQVLKLRQFEDELRSLHETDPVAKKKNIKPDGNTCGSSISVAFYSNRKLTAEVHR